MVTFLCCEVDSLTLVNRRQQALHHGSHAAVCLDPPCLCPPPDWNTSDGAFLSGEGDHQKTTLSARFQPDAAVPPRPEDVVVFSPACSTFSADGNDWKQRVQTEWASGPSSPTTHAARQTDTPSHRRTTAPFSDTCDI